MAKLIDSGLQTGVYYVRIDGFDTHAQQAGAHQSLLRQLSDAVSVDGDVERFAFVHAWTPYAEWMKAASLYEFTQAHKTRVLNAG